MTTVSKDANVDAAKDCVSVIILEVYRDLSLAARLQRVIIDCGFRLVTHQYCDTLNGSRGTHTLFHHEERGLPLARLVECIRTVVGPPPSDHPSYAAKIGTDWAITPAQVPGQPNSSRPRCTFAFA